MTNPQLLFLGDSLIEYGDWQRHFPAYDVVNLGVAGETVQGLLARLPQITRQAPRPAWACLMIGTNNVAMEDYGFLPDYEAIVTRLGREYPAAVLVITSLLPIHLPWLADNAIPRLNDQLRRVAHRRGATYLDAHAAFLQRMAGPSLFLADGVHLSTAGYETWSAAMAPFLPVT